MTKLTTDRLEQFIANPLGNPLHRTEQMDMARKLLASLEAEPVGEFYHEKQGGWYQISEGDKVSDNRRIPLYAAPVLPKQPELVESLKKVMKSWLAMEPKLAFQPEFTDVMMLIDAEPAPAQPVSEPYKLDGWISVDEKMPEATRKDQYFITYRRPNKDFKSVTGGFSIDLFRKGCFCFPAVTYWMPLPAAPTQDDKSASTELPNHSNLSTNSPVIPDAYVLDELGRMMLNGVCEPRVSFGSGWNACRAEMLKAQPVSEPYKSAANDIIAERLRQIIEEGWKPEHDDEHDKGELAMAAVCYINETGTVNRNGGKPWGWPWDASWWKPDTRRRNLVKAGALILAEIERLDRAAPAQEQK